MAITSSTTAVTQSYSAPRQVSDQNSQGTELGASAADPISFYGATPVAQLGAGAGGGFLNVTTSGTLTKYQITNATTNPGASTVAEVSSTVTGLAAADVVAVNKPAAQAGLGVVGYRVSAANTLYIAYSNISSSAITTTAEAYDVIGISSSYTTSAALTPAAVPTVGGEQLFSVPGATVGSFPIVNKPTTQTGLGISNVRVTAAGQVGITFINNSSGAITPTAGETYSFAFLPNIRAADRTLMYKVAMATSSIAATTTTDVSSTVTGLLASDVAVGASKPTYQAGIGVVGYRVSAANTLYLTYVSQSSGAITTTLEAYGVPVVRQQQPNLFAVTTQTLTPASVAATTTAEQTFTVNSLAASTSALVSKPSYTPGIHIVGVRVSAASTLAITYQNTNTSAVVPPAEIYTIGNVPLQGPGAVATTGATTQSVSGVFTGSDLAASDVATAMRTLGLMGSV